MREKHRRLEQTTKQNCFHKSFTLRS